MTIADIRAFMEIPEKEYLAPGTTACAGCGASHNLRLILKVLGKDTIIVNASGCMTLLTVYPYTPLRVNWIHNAIENAAATASGIRHALDILLEKKKIKNDFHVMCFAGDGATYDIGFQSLSGAMDRGERILYFCYDNESFGNTGFQHSSASPRASVTKTTPAGPINPIGSVERKKDMYEIAKAHKIPYIATTCSSYPLDLFKKVKRAAEVIKKNGPAFIISLSPCPTGWGFPSHKTIEMGKLAVNTGLWVLKEYDNGKETITFKPVKRKPVEEYLKEQKRFKHLFEPKKNKKILKELQKTIDNTWEEMKKRGL